MWYIHKEFYEKYKELPVYCSADSHAPIHTFCLGEFIIKRLFLDNENLCRFAVNLEGHGGCCNDTRTINEFLYFDKTGKVQGTNTIDEFRLNDRIFLR